MNLSSSMRSHASELVNAYARPAAFPPWTYRRPQDHLPDGPGTSDRARTAPAAHLHLVRIDQSAEPNAANPRRACAPSGGLSRRALIKALTFIETHLGEHFTLDDLARAAAVSRFHFARQFRVTMGTSPMDYLLRVRVERAKAILLEGEASISDTAAALGFFDQSHFGRTFRRIVGIPPKQFSRLGTLQAGT